MKDYILLLKWREDSSPPEMIQSEGNYTREYHRCFAPQSIPYYLQLELAVNKFFASQGSALRVGFDKSQYKFLATTP